MFAMSSASAMGVSAWTSATATSCPPNNVPANAFYLSSTPGPYRFRSIRGWVPLPATGATWRNRAHRCCV